MLFWWFLMSVDLLRFILSAGIGTYYFAREKSILNKPLLRGLKFGLTKNFGSMVMGSLFIVVSNPLRAVLGYIRHVLAKN